VKKVVLHRLATTKKALDACKLVEALFLEGKRVLVAFTDAGRAATFNEYLWTFSQGSFVPHSLWDGQGEADDPVVLALVTLGRPNGATVLVVVDPLPDLGEAGIFEEVHDFVTPAPEDQDKGDRWTSAGFEVQLAR
jgi:DNA polymerase IIIc chi subunit